MAAVVVADNAPSGHTITVVPNESARLSMVGENEQLSDASFRATMEKSGTTEERGVEDGEDAEDAETVYSTILEKDNLRKTVRVYGSLYRGACRMYNVVPATYFMKWESSEELRMKHHSLGLMGVKVICIALVTNTTLEILDLEDNGMGDAGCTHVAEMLRENYFISDLTLSNNNIGAEGAIALFKVLETSNSVSKLDISNNDISDNAAMYIRQALTNNNKIKDLNLSGNKFGEVAGKEFGSMLILNGTLNRLDLSNNCLRTVGMQAFLLGLKKNLGVVWLNFANNGIGLEGCVELGKVLKENNTLLELNISNNRIPSAGTLLIAKGLKTNSTLGYLDLSRNLFMADGCMIIMEMITKCTVSGLRYISFGNIQVTKQFLELQEHIERDRSLLIRHSGLAESWKHPVSSKPKLHDTTRESLCFLNSAECKKLAAYLTNNENEPEKGKTTLVRLSKAVVECGWLNRHSEIVRRAGQSVRHGQIEFNSLYRPEDLVSIPLPNIPKPIPPPTGVKKSMKGSPKLKSTKLTSPKVVPRKTKK